jgi:hypothetical protein
MATEPVVKFESSLWDLHGPTKLVWSAMTQTESPWSTRDFASSLAKDVVPALEKAGLVAPAAGNDLSRAAR